MSEKGQLELWFQILPVQLFADLTHSSGPQKSQAESRFVI